MKKILLTLTFVLSALVTFAQGVNFQELTREQAVEKAKKENKFVFIDFYTDWCGPCKMMATQVFPMKIMGDYFNPRFVSIKLNAQKGRNGYDDAEKYGVKAYPTFVILNKKGELVHMFAGGVLDSTFIDKVKEAFNPDKAFGTLKKRYDAGDRSKKLVANYLNALAKTYTVNDVYKQVEAFYKTLSDKEKITPECLYMFDEYAPVGSEKDSFLTAHREEFRKVAGRKAVDEVFERKYVAYYGQVLMGYINTTAEGLERVNKTLTSLNLPANTLYNLLYQAAMAKINGKGADDVYKEIKNNIAKLDNKQTDTLLFYTIIGLKKQFTEAQKQDLINYMHDEKSKNFVINSIKQ